MKMAVLSIYDTASKLYGRPIFAPAVGLVLREFSDQVNDGKSQYAKHPEHFTLFQLGWFEDSDGVFEQLSPAQLIATGLSCVTEDPRQLSLLKAEA